MVCDCIEFVDGRKALLREKKKKKGGGRGLEEKRKVVRIPRVVFVCLFV